MSVARGNTPLRLARLVCAWCGTARPPDLDPWCRACGGSLAAVVEGGRPSRSGATRSLWDDAEVLPAGKMRISLGEGNTPLLRLDRLFPDDEVFVKAEWMNPTGSFKDRGAAVAVSAAMDLGAEGFVCASTGNNATSVSAYAARAGLACIVTVPATTPVAKVAHARAYGPTLLKVPGDFSDALHMAERIRLADPRWANLTSTYMNPYMTAAHATIMYELHRQLGGRVGTILMPIGAGPMLAGILQGAERLQELGEMTALPVLVGVQSSGCAPIAQAFAEGRDEVLAWEQDTFGVTGSINDPLRGYPEDGTRTLRAIRSTGGFAQAVSDADIMRAMEELGRREGIIAEPAAVAPLAALRLLLARHDLPRPIVLVVSGHALKDPASLPGAATDLSVRDLSPAQIIAAAQESLAGR